MPKSRFSEEQNVSLTFTRPSDMRALMRIPAADLRAQHGELRTELTAAFRLVLDASAFIGALPLYPELSDEAVATVCSAVRRWATRLPASGS